MAKFSSPSEGRQRGPVDAKIMSALAQSWEGVAAKLNLPPLCLISCFRMPQRRSEQADTIAHIASYVEARR